MSNTPLGTKRYFTGLDGLRALAVIAVIAYHLDIPWVPGGFLGVDMFFVLSGYLVTDLLLTQRSSEGLHLGRFWYRRFRRLVPALAVMIVTVVAWITITDHDLLRTLRGDVFATTVYGNNWWLIFHEVSYFDRFGVPNPFVHLWSLAVEGQFYIVWPLLLAIGLRYTPKRIHCVSITLLLIALSAIAMAWMYEPGNDPSRVYYGTDTRAFGLLIGAALAMLLPSKKWSQIKTSSSRKLLNLLGGGALIILFYQISVMNEFEDYIYEGGLVAVALTTAILIAALLRPDTLLSKLFSWTPLRWIGVRAYGIYLWHFPIIELTKPAVDTDGFNVLLAIMQVIVSVFLAALSYRYIEEPIRRGAITAKWKQIQSRSWKWSRISRSQWIVSASSCLVGIIFFVGMFSGTTIATSGTVIPDSHFNASESNPKDLLGPLPPNPSLGPVDTPHEERTEEQSDRTSTKGTETIQQHPSTPKKKDTSTKDAASKSWSDVTAIGDSVMLDGKPYLEELLPGISVDAEIGRQMSKAVNVLGQLAQNNQLDNKVVIGLGTNGNFNKKQLITFLHSLDGVDHIFLVNTRVPRKWERLVNTALEDVSSTMPNVTLIDWYSASGHHDSYFSEDGVHLTIQGSKAYAALIANAIKRT
ncbi:acyltransferase family protein [Paenibacillus terrigena]|uniref:acyltransferase family protein n=1 Tax=Paenibacillus terrigena TaxID=369333 RepID=UPI0003704FCD|nr:acyltransferase family protein [Paenibacillus terrigena]